MCRIDIYNESKGDLTGYNCDKCKNRGYFMTTNSQGYDYLIECECMKMRKLIQVAQNCGLGDALKKCKLQNFEHKEKWQDDIYNKAKDAGLNVCEIIDNGLTEFHGVKTKTCLAIGPDLSDKIDPITGNLKLL